MPTTSLLCIPQWQGSGAKDARLIADGARATAALLPDARRLDVAVRDDPGTKRDGVANLDVLIENLRLVRAALASEPVRRLLIAGGDCGVELGPISAAAERHGDALTLLWLDAHADLNTPSSSPSGAFHGMVLRTLLGDGPSELVPERPLRPDQVVLAGTRAFDPAEREYIAAAGLRHIGIADIERIGELTGPVYVHIDLDVLDPDHFASTNYPEPEGVSPERLAAALGRLREVVGISVVERAPHPPTAASDEAAIRTLLAALAV